MTKNNDLATRHNYAFLFITHKTPSCIKIHKNITIKKRTASDLQIIMQISLVYRSSSTRHLRWYSRTTSSHSLLL